MLWTVVRFPNGSWSYGGKPTDPDYAECEVYSIEARDGKAAVKKARDKRSAMFRPKKPKADGKVITQQELKELFDHDDELGALRWRHTERRHKAGEIAGGRAENEYHVLRINNRAYQVHRLIWLYAYGEFPANQIDHINHKRHDNRLCNLRDVTGKENLHNMSTNKRNWTGTVGVTWDPLHEAWKARIGADGKMIQLGRFKNKEDAIAARKAAELIYHPTKPRRAA